MLGKGYPLIDCVKFFFFFSLLNERSFYLTHKHIVGFFIYDDVLIDSVVLTSAVQRSDPVIYTYFSYIPFIMV